MIWQSVSLVRIPIIKVSLDVKLIFSGLQNYVPGKELSVLFKAVPTKRGFEVLPEWVLPAQEVTTTSVDYREDLSAFRKQGFLCVTHSHPFTSDKASFSANDWDNINANFPVSLLFNGKGEITDWTLTITPKENDQMRLQLGRDEVELRVRPSLDIKSRVIVR